MLVCLGWRTRCLTRIDGIPKGVLVLVIAPQESLRRISVRAWSISLAGLDLLPFQFLTFSLLESALQDAFIYTCMRVMTGALIIHVFDACLQSLSSCHRAIILIRVWG